MNEADREALSLSFSVSLILATFLRLVGVDLVVVDVIVVVAFVVDFDFEASNRLFQKRSKAFFGARLRFLVFKKSVFRKSNFKRV